MGTLQHLLDRFRLDIREYLRSQESAAGSKSPMKVPLTAPTFGEDEIVEALHSLLLQNVTMDKKVTRFEQMFADYIGVRHAVMVNSGSSANLLIMAALANPLCPPEFRLSPGDEVLVPAVTWPTTLWPVTIVGMVPVLVDADLRTLNMNVEAATRAIEDKTRAIFVTHILGNAADMDGFCSLAEDHSLVLLEDACESLGTLYKGRLVGSFSLAASFSFFFSHHITTIEGGMIVTPDDSLADMFRCLRSHGWSRHMKARHEVEARYPHLDPRFLFVNVGYNLRPTEMQAAFGLHQLTKVAEFNKRRKRVAAKMIRRLEPLAEHLQFVEPTEGADHTWFGFPVMLTEKHAGERQAFVHHLESAGIETRPVIAGNLARQPALEHFPHRIAGNLSNAQAIMDRGLYWGSHPAMTDDQIDHLAMVVGKYFRP